MVIRRPAIALLLLVVLSAVAGSQARIERLDRDDPVYRQHQQLIAEYYRSAGADESTPSLFLFQYDGDGEEGLFSLAANLMIPYAALATLNRLEDSAPPDGPILIPSQPGLFVFMDPRNDIERELYGRFVEGPGSSLPFQEFTLRRAGTAERVRFYPGADFSPVERDRFLRVRFRNPLPEGVVSSPYGYRIHPISGVWSFHHGIDLAADFGTPVVTAASGIVRSIDREPWLGLTVTVDHGNGFTSVYAHLQESLVSVGTPLADGATIGFVGSTGLSTGPHLHFELRYRDESRNPEQYLIWR